jgi:hypothetical protein
MRLEVCTDRSALESNEQTASISTEVEHVPWNVCQHGQVREIGYDFDEQGRLLRLIRCRHCGLLMREYLRSR